MADYFIDKIKQARADAAQMDPEELRQYIINLLAVANTLETQAKTLEGYARNERDITSVRFGAGAGERQYQQVITGETIAGARAEAAAIRALAKELEPGSISESAQARIWGDGYDAGTERGDVQ